MMKLIHSFIHSLFPFDPPTPRAASSVAVSMRTYANLSAKGLPLGTDYTAAFSGLNAQNLDPLRTTWRELVASASNRPAWLSGAGAPACPPGAAYRPLARCLAMVHTSARRHHLDPLRTAWRELVASASE
jgi:hypothetical protein